MVRRPLHPEDIRLWTLVTATVRPSKGRDQSKVAPAPPTPAPPTPVPSPTMKAKDEKRRAAATQGINGQADLLASLQISPPVLKPPLRPHFPDVIEPRRKRRISLAREPIGARLDLHGLDQDRARSAVHSFIQRAHADGLRAVLIITGKGSIGDGVLRRRTPDWLAEPVVRPMVAGLSPAERHHGGEGALYVALKRGHRP